MMSNGVNMIVSDLVDLNDVNDAFNQRNIQLDTGFDVELASGDIHNVDIELMIPFERDVAFSMLEMPTQQMGWIRNGLALENHTSIDGSKKSYSGINPGTQNDSYLIGGELLYSISGQVSSRPRTYSTSMRKIQVRVTRGSIHLTVGDAIHRDINSRNIPHEFPWCGNANCKVTIRNASQSASTYELIGTYIPISQ